MVGIYVKMSKRFCASTSVSLHGRRWESSLHGEAAGLLDGRQQLLVELLVGLVGRDVDPVETGNREEPFGAEPRAEKELILWRVLYQV